MKELLPTLQLNAEHGCTVVFMTSNIQAKGDLALIPGEKIDATMARQSPIKPSTRHYVQSKLALTMIAK